ncbi:hypothetical protein [Lacticaseibacillus brantae]|nr:hypothetical protein [Lacticaseibacillus brantae]
MNDEMLIQFLQQIAGIRIRKWQQNRTTTGTLSHAEKRQLRSMLTDYEWMLVQKLVPEFSDDAIGLARAFNAAKLAVAKVWLQSPGLSTRFVKLDQAGTQTIHLQVRLEYVLGLLDVLDFAVPASVATQLETHQLDLLTWANQQ